MNYTGIEMKAAERNTSIMERIGSVTLYHARCEDILPTLPSGSIGIILTDPPYLYLGKQKLDAPFDEAMVFREFCRLLKPGGFVVMFGRGPSFYRRNTLLNDLGLSFKEEIVWDKSYCTSPLMAMSRVHETVSIHVKGHGAINRCKVPYLEMRGYDLDAIIRDIKRLNTVFGNPRSLAAVQNFLRTKKRDVSDCWHANDLSISSDISKSNRCVSVMQSMTRGLNEKTIIRQAREHHAAIHPTQKPVRLLERLLNLVKKEDDIVLDPFAGSGSTGIAADNLGIQSILIEKDAEYFASARKRLEQLFSNKGDCLTF